MKKRIMALVLAAVLAVAPAESILAEELLIEEIQQAETYGSLTEEMQDAELLEESAADVYGEEFMEDISEPSDTVQMSGDEEDFENVASDEFSMFNGGDMILDIQEVETRDYVSDGSEEILSEYAAGQVEESGLAAYASYPMFRMFAEAQYVDSYGGQLDGNAKALYDQMVASYVTVRGSGTFVYTFTTPLTFGVTGTLQKNEDNANELIWDKDANEEYQDVMAELRYTIQAAYDAFIYDYPEVFWIGAPKYGYNTSFSGSGSENFVGTGKIASVTIMPEERYTGASSEISAFDMAVNNVYSQLNAGISGSASRKEKLQVIHDYLCNSVSYAENDYAHTAAGVFLKDRAVVCEGYAKAFKILCQKFGIESVLIPGGAKTSSGIEGHMWNYVKMEDGNWYLVDVTWDDQSSYISDTYFLAGNLTVGFNNITIYEEREQNRYPNFSSSANTQSFAFPILSDCAYHTDHTWTQYISDNNATCSSDGTKTATCDVEGCDVKNTVTEEGTMDAARHQIVHTASVAATCTTAGNTEYWHCSACEKCFSDQNGKNEITQSSTVVPATGHQAAHTASVAATCTTAGNTEYWYCSVCKKYFSDQNGKNEITQSSTVIPATGHQAAHTASVAATCTTDGNTEYWYCSVCKKYFSDQNGKNEITQSSTVIPATGHSYGAYVQTKAPTVFVQGTETRTCSRCKATQSRATKCLEPTIKVNAEKITLKVKQATTKLTVSGLAAGDRVVSWKSENDKIATVSASGKITGKKAGSTKITITLASKLTKTIDVKVQKTAVKTTGISGLSKKMTLEKGKKATLKPVISPITSLEKVTYSSSNKKVATVSSKGVITAKKSGTAKITVKSGKKKFVVTVSVPKTATQAIRNVSAAVTLKKGKSFTLKPKLTPANSEDKITYKSSNKKVVTVSSKGKITAKKKGTAIITVKSGKVSVTCKVTVA